jgi:FMN phosphatase YigB (HAD superfamily)
VGIGKPDPDIFALTLREIGAKAESAVMVGDSWECDILDALHAGLSAVWVFGGRPHRRSARTSRWSAASASSSAAASDPSEASAARGT